MNKYLANLVIFFIILLNSNLAYSEFNEYRIENLLIEAKETDLPLAKQHAINEGIKRALHLLISKKTPSFNSLEFEQDLSNYVQNFEITSEDIINGTYQAHLNINFDQFKINQLLNNSSLLSATTIVIIPLFNKKGSLMLWEEENPWLEIWHKIAKDHKNLKIPLGEIEDVVLFENIDKIVANDLNLDKYSTIFEYYKSNKILLAEAICENDNCEHIKFETKLITKSSFDKIYSNEKNVESSLSEVLLSGANEILTIIVPPQAITQAPPQAMIQVHDAPKENFSYILNIQIKNFNDWLDIKAILSKIFNKDEFHITEISTSLVIAEIKDLKETEILQRLALVQLNTEQNEQGLTIYSNK